MNACHASVPCIDLNDCWYGCSGDEALAGVPKAECPRTCEKRFTEAMAAFHAWDDCALRNCDEECKRSEHDEE
jgi:hypothetical protein